MTQRHAVIPNLTQVVKPCEEVGTYQKSYTDFYENNDDADAKRQVSSAHVSDLYYNLVTDFFEYGWGCGFHFCPMRVGESFEHAQGKYQYRLALKLALKKGVKCLDVGCGVGGPGRNIATLSGATIYGININKYQLERCRFHAKFHELEDICKYIEGDFHDMPIPDNWFDAAFSVESTCHSEDKKVFKEIYRILKPGSKFAFYEWIMTDNFDPNNKDHARIKHGILLGNGLPDLQTADECLASLRQVGFKVLEAEDISGSATLPWYYSLQGRWTIAEFKSTPLGMFLSHYMLYVLETLRLSPKGSVKVHGMIIQAARDLIEAGKLGIFTPCYMVVAEKPQES